MNHSDQLTPRQRGSQFSPAELEAMRRRRNRRYWLAAVLCMVIFVGAIWALLEKTKWSAGPSARAASSPGVQA